MTPEQWHQARQILEQASAADPADRARVLEAACGSDALMRATVERLLGHQQRMADFLEVPLLANLSLLEPEKNSAETIGRHIGPYRIQREIGRGGMGVVYLAVSEEDQQQVAIKLIWPGLDSQEVLRRFHQERLILAKLSHDNIARLLNAGTTEDGWPYLALEYVDGVPITTYCAEQQLSLPDRLKLFQSVCAVVEHAHRNRVIHRDLKPGNILVTADGATKLLDFGIAKLLEPDPQLGAVSLTRSLLPVMTPEYASPEQVRGQSITVTTDVYSLGIVLYELLTGRRPFKFESTVLPEIIRVICEEEPPRPSDAIRQTESTEMASAPEKLRRQIAGDLDNIVLMALRKEPSRRYQSVEQLSQDIDRHFEGQPVMARQGTLSYRTEKFIRRHRAGVISVTTIFLVLIIAAITFLWQVKAAKEQGQRNWRALYVSQMKQAKQDWDEGTLARLQETLNRFLPQPGQEDLRGFEWHYLWRLAHCDLRTLSYPATVNAIAYSPDGKLLAVAFENGTVRLWDLATERELMMLGRADPTVLPTTLSPNGQSLAFSPDGSQLAVGTNDGFKLWNLATSEETSVFQGEGQITSITFSPDGQRIITGSAEGITQLWNVATQKKLMTLGEKTQYLHGVVFFPDGKKFATAGEDRLIRLYDAASGRLLDTLKGHNGEVIALAVSPDGRFLASGGGDNVALLWDVAARKRARTLVSTQTEIRAVAFSPDGQMLATGSGDRTVKLWDVATGREIHTFKGHTGKIVTLAFSPDGKHLASGSDDRTVKMWDVTSSQEAEIIENPSGKLMSLAISPNGQKAATGDNQGVTQLWDLTTSRKLETLLGHERGLSVTSIVFSPDGQQLATTGHDSAVILWTSLADHRFVNFRRKLEEHYGVFSPDGRAIEVRSDGGPVTLLDMESRQELLTLKGHTGPVRSIAFSADGKMIATGSEDRTAKLWDATTGRELKTFTGLKDRIGLVLLTPDGKTLIADGRQETKAWDIATGHTRYYIKADIAPSPDGKKLVGWVVDGQTPRIYEAATGHELITINGLPNDVLTSALSSESQCLATCHRNGTVILWDTITGRKLSTFPAHTAMIQDAAFSSDGRILVTASDDHTMKLWDVATRREIRSFEGRAGGTRSVVFAPDGAKLLTAERDGVVKLWDVAKGQTLVSRSVSGFYDGSHSVAFSPDGKILAAGTPTITLLNTATRQTVAKCEGHAGGVYAICFSPDGQRLVSGNVDTTARVWDAATGRELLNLKGHQSIIQSVAFSPDGKVLATGSHDHTAKLWDAATGRLLATLNGHADEVSSVAFSPDGKRLVTGSGDHTIKVWDVETGQELITLKGHTDQVTGVAFTPDGKTLLSVSLDRTMRIWRAATNDKVEAQGKKGRTLFEKTETARPMGNSSRGIHPTVIPKTEKLKPTATPPEPAPTLENGITVVPIQMEVTAKNIVLMFKITSQQPLGFITLKLHTGNQTYVQHAVLSGTQGSIRILLWMPIPKSVFTYELENVQNRLLVSGKNDLRFLARQDKK